MRTSVTQLCEAVQHRSWKVTRNGKIRSGRSNNCPLVAAAMDLNYLTFRRSGGHAGEHEWEKAATAIGFRTDSDEFTYAVDYTLAEMRSKWVGLDRIRLIKIRKKVFRLLGLPESKL